MMEEDTSGSSNCHECKRPLIALDFYGERLKGCPNCNIWWTPTDIKKRLSEADLRALHDMMHHSAHRSTPLNAQLGQPSNIHSNAPRLVEGQDRLTHSEAAF